MMTRGAVGDMDKQKFPMFETVSIIIGELIVSAIISAVFLILKKFDISVLLGSLLGSLVTVINFFILVITANRAIDRALSERGEGEMTDEEAAEFAAKQSGSLQAAIKISYIVRTFLLLAALVVAFLLDGVFNVIATVIPLLMYRPLITIPHLFKKKEK
jgi:uncharacterized membrane protein